MLKKEFLVLFLALSLVFWRVLTPGIHVASDLHYAYDPEAKELLQLPQTWNTRGAGGLGEYATSTLWNWPINIFIGLLARVGIPFNIAIVMVGFLPSILLGVYAIFRLLDNLEVRQEARLVAGAFYLLNTYFILLLDGGQVTIALAYAWFPLSYLGIVKSIGKDVKSNILAGLAVSVLGFLDIRFVYVLFLLLLLKFLYDLFLSRTDKLKIFLVNWLGTALIAGITFVGLNAYWIYPAAKSQSVSLPEAYQRVTQASFLSFANLGHALFLLQPHWFKNVFGKITELKAEFVLIPVLAFLAPILRKKSKEVGFWLLVALVGVFLVKGANPPLTGAYPWLFTNIPGFSLFRDPTKFFFLVALSYSVLMGITIDELSKRFKLKIAIVPFLLTLYFIILIRPVWLGKMTGTFSLPIHQQEYLRVADILEKDSGYGRVFWIPTTAPLGYSSPTHPSVEASRLVGRRPFAAGVVGTYEIFNFLREAPYMGELFDVASVGYIAYPFPDTRREDLKKDNIDYYHAFLDQIDDKGWIEKRVSELPVALLKTKESQDHFYLTANTFFAVGSDAIYKELFEENLLDLSANAFIFGEEKAGLGNMCKDHPCTVLLYDKGFIDFAATLIDGDNFIFPAQNLDLSPSTSSGSSSWWKREGVDLVWWRNFLHEKYGVDNLDFDYGGGYAISEGNRQLLVSTDKFQKGNILLARVMSSNRGGKIEFFQGLEKIGEINTKIQDPSIVELKLTGYREVPSRIFEFANSNVSWFEVGRLLSNEPLEIRTEGDINVVNALVSIPEAEWQSINESIHEYNLIDWNSLGANDRKALFLEKNDAKVSYNRVSSTHYKVKVENLKEPATLAFSETFDPLWELNGKASYPLYSLINGFVVEEDGEYDVYFSAQKYVIPGLIISGVTLLIVLVLLLLKRFL